MKVSMFAIGLLVSTITLTTAADARGGRGGSGGGRSYSAPRSTPPVTATPSRPSIPSMGTLLIGGLLLYCVAGGCHSSADECKKHETSGSKCEEKKEEKKE